MSSLLERRGKPPVTKLIIQSNFVVNNSDLPDGLRSQCKLKLRLKAWTLPPLEVLTPDHYNLSECTAPILPYEYTMPLCPIQMVFWPQEITTDGLTEPNRKVARVMTQEEEDEFFEQFFE